MAIDHAMLDLAEDTGALLWRLYRWDPHCLSFGRHEPAARRYNRSKIESLGLATVRRPTGGRAVWHAQELTYAVAGPLAILGSLKAAYRSIHEILARAVTHLCGRASLAPERRQIGLGRGGCFAEPVGGEVVVDTKKVIGSAQRRGTLALLQHGSMLLEDDQSLIADLEVSPGHRVTSEATLSSLAGRTISFEEAARAVATALPSPAGPPEFLAEILRRARLHYDTYQSDQWTWER